VVIFRLFGEKPIVPIETKICMAGNLADIITCAKFQDKFFRGYDFTGGGGPIFHFPIDFCMGLTTVHDGRAVLFALTELHVGSN